MLHDWTPPIGTVSIEHEKSRPSVTLADQIDAWTFGPVSANEPLDAKT